MRSLQLHSLIVTLIFFALGLLLEYKRNQSQRNQSLRNQSQLQSGGGEVEIATTNNQEKLIKGLKFSSNTGLDLLSSEYSSKNAGLQSPGAWGGNPELKYFTYLEVGLPSFHHVTGIVTAGNEDLREWVTEFYLEYWDDYKENWVKIQKVFKGNTDDKTLIVNRLDIKTSKIRVYPVNWEGYPSMRVGLIGTLANFSNCKFYKAKIKSVEPGQRRYYQILYDQKCRKIDHSKYQEVLDALQKRDQKLRVQENTISTLTDQLNHMKRDYCPKEQLIELAIKCKELNRLKIKK